MCLTKDIVNSYIKLYSIVKVDGYGNRKTTPI
jgi:hypothetical protein